MDQPSYPPHQSRVQDRPDPRADARRIIYAAVELLQAEHDVPQNSAYMILVQAAVDAGTKVRDAAARIVEEARVTA